MNSPARSAKPLAHGFSTWMMVTLVLAGAWFLLRGPLRGLHSGGADFAAPYVAALRFFHGRNPYSSSDFLSAWRAAGAPAGSDQNLSGTKPVYPPTTLALMLPFSLLPWPYALALFEALCSLLYLHLLVLLARYADEGWKRTGVLAFGLALSPVHAGFAMANISVLAFVLAMYSLILAWKGSQVPSGILLALSLCFKPSAAVPLLLYSLLRRHWKSSLWTVATSAAITCIAMLRMYWVPSAWVSDYRANVRFLFGPQGVANFTSLNDHRFDLVNLQVPLFVLERSSTWANVSTWLIVTLLFAVWFFRFAAQPGRAGDRTAIASLLLLGLLPIYQRNYNAGWVLLAALWGFQSFPSRAGKWMLAVCAVCLVPGQAMLRVLNSRMSLWNEHNPLVNFVVMPQLTWAILAMIVLLLARRIPFSPANSRVLAANVGE